MNDVVSYYDRPAFRSGVGVLVGDTRAVFTYDLVSFDVDLNAAAAEQMDRLCRVLAEQSGLAISTVDDEFGAFAPHVWEILGALDKYGFLTERGTPDPEHVVSGEVFWHQIEAFASRAKSHFRPVLYPALTAGLVPRGALLRYALEYFHVVRNGPRIIAGSLAHVATDRTRQLLEQFLTQEVGHDRMLIRALEAGGMSEAEARRTQPLPETFALIAGLQTMADQDPLSFKSVAFLMEESSPEFHNAFRHACEAAGFADEFWSPILLHAEINDEGDHASISAELLAEVAVVGTEERAVVLKNVAYMIESLVALEHAVLDSRNALLAVST